jgi:hypothetical protein
MTMTNKVLLLVVLAAACGSKNKNNAEEGGATIDTQATSGDPTDRSGEMVSAEKMDEVNSLLSRKQMIISRCLSTAVEAGEAPKGSRGKIVLAISISTGGKATSVEVVKTSFTAKSVEGCVKRHVEEITFPTMPKQYDTSFTYAMEAN